MAIPAIFELEQSCPEVEQIDLVVSLISSFFIITRFNSEGNFKDLNRSSNRI